MAWDVANFKTVGLGGWGGWPPTQDAWDSRWKRQPVESCKLNKFATYFPCFPSLVFPSFLRRFLPTLLPSFSFASFPPFCISSFLPFYHFLSLFDPVYVFCCAVDIHFIDPATTVILANPHWIVSCWHCMYVQKRRVAFRMVQLTEYKCFLGRASNASDVW